MYKNMCLAQTNTGPFTGHEMIYVSGKNETGAIGGNSLITFLHARVYTFFVARGIANAILHCICSSPD